MQETRAKVLLQRVGLRWGRFNNRKEAIELSICHPIGIVVMGYRPKVDSWGDDVSLLYKQK